ncbi:MAG: AMP-binding protein [Anaerovoracaceae bacterium]|jgi:acetyl-CoA synthetase
MNDVCARYIEEEFDENGVLDGISFKNTEHFNFAYDVLDEMAASMPDRLCLWYVDHERNERKFTFGEMKKLSDKAANYFRGIGIDKGDRVMLVLRRHYQFWIAILALHKIGAVAIPATYQLKESDFKYRFEAGGLKAIVVTDMDRTAEEAGRALDSFGGDVMRIMTGTPLPGWDSFDEGVAAAPEDWERVPTRGDDIMLIFFTSGTTGYPKMVQHDFRYPLGHYITAKYWQNVDPEGLHFSVADTGWGKALWGKLYGQWLCGAAVFVYDMDNFVPHDFLSLFGSYPITTFCAPPTAYRVFVKRDLSRYDLSKLKYVTTAGEALNPEVWQNFYQQTGLKIMEGFGQTETTMSLGNLVGTEPKPGSMGKPSPMYDVGLINDEGREAAVREPGELVIRTGDGAPCGLFRGYAGMEEKTREVWHDGVYYTGDMAYIDDDGYYWFIGRADDVIKSCGYRVGPFEVESVIMELPYIQETAVIGVPDRARGQKIKAYVRLAPGTEPSKKLAKEIMRYARGKMAHYKCPREVEFVDELPKTISGKVRRTTLRK